MKKQRINPNYKTQLTVLVKLTGARYGTYRWESKSVDFGVFLHLVFSVLFFNLKQSNVYY